MIRDVSEAEFADAVIERSRELPVVVDFWAEWCGPCRQLGPALEAAIRAREGKIELAKVDVDANGMLAQAFRVQGIPAVKAFRDAQVAAEFTGALPPRQIDEFLDGLLPSEAELLAQNGDENSLRAALEKDPRHTPAALALGRILIERGDRDEAETLLRDHSHDFIAQGLLARLELTGTDREDELVDRACASWDQGDRANALERLQEAVLAAKGDAERRDLLRRLAIAVMTELGTDNPLAREHRRRLAAALN